MTNVTVETIVDRLIEQLKENEETYRTAMNNAESSQLREHLRERVQQCRDFITQLESASWEHHEVPDESALGSIQRGLLTLKAAMTIERDKTDEIVFSESREADNRLLEAYRQALDEELPLRLRTLIQNQYSQIQAAHAYIGASSLRPGEYAVIGLFATIDGARQALGALDSAGFSNEQISIIAQEEAVREALQDARVETAQQGAGATAVGGTIVGSLIGLAAGLSIPIAFPVLAAGTIAAAIGTAALGAGIGATYGGIFGALLGWGMAEEDTHRYVEGVRRGEILLAVQTRPERAEEAVDILRRAGGTGIAKRHESLETPDQS